MPKGGESTVSVNDKVQQFQQPLRKHQGSHFEAQLGEGGWGALTTGQWHGWIYIGQHAHRFILNHLKHHMIWNARTKEPNARTLCVSIENCSNSNSFFSLKIDNVAFSAGFLAYDSLPSLCTTLNTVNGVTRIQFIYVYCPFKTILLCVEINQNGYVHWLYYISCSLAVFNIYLHLHFVSNTQTGHLTT